VLDLVRDVLDKPLLDAKGRPFGMVDGLVLELSADAPPRVVALEVGTATRLARLPRWLARPLRWWRERATTTRIARADVLGMSREIRVAVDAVQTPAWRVEDRLARLLARIPGGG
jgi:hypothetical protein